MSQIQVTGEAKIRDLQGPVVANAGVITALDGSANQYVRGDGALASFPTVTGGGSSVSLYLNGSVNQGTFGGSTYYQLGDNAITGVGTNFSASANGLLAQFITDANVPDQTEIPSGNWNIEFYMGVSASSGSLASFYVEIYKYDGTTFTLIGTNVATPELLTNTTTVDAYFTSVAMPLTALAQTDRIAVRVFVNVAGKTVTLYTEDNRLCQVVTTFSRGILSLNNLTDQQQFFSVGTSGTDFNISSVTDIHTFNIPIASAINTGKLSSTDWSIFNAKQHALTFSAPLINTSNTISIPAATSLVDGYLDNLDWVNFNTAYNDSIISAGVTGTTTKTLTLNQQDGGTITASWTDDNTDAVTSVFGRTGAVVATSGDYNTDLVTEGTTNLYFTNARSRAALSFTAGSGAYNSTTGVITIPTNNNQLTNGASYITLGSLSAGTGINYNNTTGVITNSAPDQTVSLTAGAGISISGTYPSFTIASTITQYTDALARAAISGGTGISYNSTTGVITNTITQYTDALARAAISLTTTGSSGSSTYSSITGVLNVPTYTLAGLGGISLTSLSATTPLSYNNTTGTFSIQQANTSQDGYLSSTDWNTFNSKGNGTVTSVAALTLGTTGTDLSSSVANGTTTPVITLNVPTASATNRGALSSADWTTFNNKQGALTLTTTGTSGAATLVGNTLNIPQYSGGGGMAIGGSITSATVGSVLFAGASGVLAQDNANFFWDDTNNRLGIGTITPTAKVNIVDGNIYITNSTASASTVREFFNYINPSPSVASSNGVIFGFRKADSHYSRGASIRFFQSGTSDSFGDANTNISFWTYSLGVDNGVERVRIDNSGNLAIGTTTIGSKLQVNGNAAIGYSASTAAPTNGLAVSGKIGVGQSTASSQIDILGSTDGIFNDGIRFIRNGTPTQYLMINYSGGAARFLANDQVTPGSGQFIWSVSSDGSTQTERMRIAPVTGNLGIGTTTIGSKLQVNGNAAIGYSASTAAPTNGLAVSGNITSGGSITSSGGFFDTSDSRLKTLITNNYQAKGIQNITPKLYVKNGKEELGYYAQDLQEILPSSVNEGNDGFLTLSYSQVHTAKIAYLEEKIAQLEELIKTLL